MFQCRTRRLPFRPHHRFAVPLPRSRRGGLVTRRFLAESRNISFPRRCGGSGERSEPIGALMPHAALWVVQRRLVKIWQKSLRCFNAARGFVGGAAVSGSTVSSWRRVSMPHAALWVVQPQGLHRFTSGYSVSMPHAALWVVQLRDPIKIVAMLVLFQCRTRLCGWCSRDELYTERELGKFQCRTRLCGWCSKKRASGILLSIVCFNAARGFVGGAASSLAVLFPLGGKSSFGKSPEI